ncbi:MAG TPA: LLM class flavin-dependent oxidoreductase [Stellaceae bacterium]|jgi:alkanesulfonate monooxygenase SsuD/methylene tetrahydromethanopterin reductase-like flavin-dependent oxidoreductase (luciferase family)|nr:LLM class flavin-dependent oxidoreductase [Stellaceae bacterium]
MRFGIFDHLDDSGQALNRHFESRLNLVEAYDRAGFYAYHLAEHHNTPLGYAPSPSVFLSAVAQRTHKLKFGPMVYLLPLYHPLRLIDEICMLDQMSNGRFLYGVGRGISPIEVGFYGVEYSTGAAQFREAFDVIRLGLTEDRVTYHGKFYDFDNIPMAMKPYQKPLPELWYGLGNPASIPWAAANAANWVVRRPVPLVRETVDAYRAEWKKLGRADSDIPLMGVNRHIVIAETEAAAKETAGRAYPAWRHHMGQLWHEYNVPFPLEAALPPDFETVVERGDAIAGTPDQVRAYIAREIEETGVNYYVCDFAFGRMTEAEAMRSVELFAKEVMPAFA